MRYIRSVVVVTGIIIALFALLWYHGSLIFSESLYTEKGSYPYYLLTSDEVKALPLLDPDEHSIQYYYSAGDSNKEPRDALHYLTAAPAADIVEFYQQYFLSKGLSQIGELYETQEGVRVIFSDNSHEFIAIVYQGAPMNEVAVEYITSFRG